MTSRLYYDDAFLKEFDASVVRTETRDEQTLVWLDRTAFYPTSGGQPFDVGSLAGLPVLDVHDDDSGEIAHAVTGTAPVVGTFVRGVIDWTRRFDHMQQHTGQHLLSAAIEHAYGARTISFHLGASTCTIDLDKELTAKQIEKAEHDANVTIWHDVPVSLRYVSEEEAKQLPLRKESVRTGTLRLVEIEGMDLSACGGTHVSRTGMIGQIVVASWERFKGGQRLEFLCGQRALSRAQQQRDVSAAMVRSLSVLPGELPAAVERLQSELKEQRRALGAAQQDLAKYEAVDLLAAAEAHGSGRALFRLVDGDAVRLKTLATAAIAAATASTAPDAAPPLLIVLVSSTSPAIAVAARTATAADPCHELIAALAKQFGGRGGGKPDLAQCGGLQAAPEQILETARSFRV